MHPSRDQSVCVFRARKNRPGQVNNRRVRDELAGRCRGGLVENAGVRSQQSPDEEEDGLRFASFQRKVLVKPSVGRFKPSSKRMPLNLRRASSVSGPTRHQPRSHTCHTQWAQNAGHTTKLSGLMPNTGLNTGLRCRRTVSRDTIQNKRVAWKSTKRSYFPTSLSPAWSSKRSPARRPSSLESHIGVWPQRGKLLVLVCASDLDPQLAPCAGAAIRLEVGAGEHLVTRRCWLEVSHGAIVRVAPYTGPRARLA